MCELICVDICYGLFVSFQNSYVETLTPNVMVFGDGALCRVDEVMRVGPGPKGLVSLKEETPESSL